MYICDVRGYQSCWWWQSRWSCGRWCSWESRRCHNLCGFGRSVTPWFDTARPKCGQKTPKLGNKIHHWHSQLHRQQTLWIWSKHRRVNTISQEALMFIRFIYIARHHQIYYELHQAGRQSVWHTWTSYPPRTRTLLRCYIHCYMQKCYLLKWYNSKCYMQVWPAYNTFV